MKVDFCARPLGPSRSSRKIFTLRSDRRWILAVVVLAVAAPPAFCTSIPFTLTDANNLPLSGTSVVLRLPNYDTGTVSSSTDDQGKTGVNTGNIPAGGVIVDFHRCPNGMVVGVQHDAPSPCEGATLLGTVPVVPGVTQAITIGGNGVVASMSGGTFVESTSSGTTVFVNGQEAYHLTEDSDSQTYIAYVDNKTGTTTGLSGVPPSAVGQNFIQLQTAYGQNPRALVQGPTSAVPAGPTPSSPIPFTLTDANNLPLSGTNVVLQLPNSSTPSIFGPTNDQGKTVVSTANIPSLGLIVDFYRCPNGTVVGVPHDAARPCNEAKLIGTVPVVPGVTQAVTIGQNGVIASISDNTFVASDANGSATVFINGQEAYNLADDPTYPQSYSAYVDNKSGTKVVGVSGIPPIAVGRRTFSQLQSGYGHNPATLVLQPAGATSMLAPKPVAQTPVAPASYTKPPRRSVVAKCPECQQYADEFNSIAAYIDDLWQRKISLQRGIDITRS